MYNGEFSGGKKHGKDIIEFNGSEKAVACDIPWKKIVRYDGELVRGKVRGFGKCLFAEGVVYEGHFCAGIMSGFGKLKHQNGNLFDGEFKNGLKNGEGKLFYFDRSDNFGASPYNRVYNGEWKHDNPICGEFKHLTSKPEEHALPILKLKT